MKKQTTLLTVTTAMFVALGLLLPQIFHFLPNGGVLFSPMHLPVLLCGLICGPLMGAIAGGLTPVLSSLIFGMPPFPTYLVPMFFELIAYGFFAGFFNNLFAKKSKKFAKNSFLPSLVISMILGRVVNVIVKVAFTMLFTEGAAFGAVLVAALTGTFVSTWAGAALQIVIVPIIMVALQKGHILDKYPDKDEPQCNANQQQAE